MVSYQERAPWPQLAGAVRTVWIQRTDDEAYVQRHLPTGGIELQFPIGGDPVLLGPLTRAEIEVIPARTTVVGVRCRPGAGLPTPIDVADLVNQRISLRELWGGTVDPLVEAMLGAESPDRVLDVIQGHLLLDLRRGNGVDPLVGEAVRRLMPWQPLEVSALAGHLALSPSQLRRRCLRAVGMSPKVLQRTLRFQGFLALAQAGALAPDRRGADDLAELAVQAGYADQAHLSRECRRLTGVTPSRLLGGTVDRCRCGHDHAASFRPFLASRRSAGVPVPA